MDPSKLTPADLETYLKMAERYGLAPLILGVVGGVLLLLLWSMWRAVKPLIIEVLKALIANIKNQTQLLAEFRNDIKTFHRVNDEDRVIYQRHGEKLDVIQATVVNVPVTLGRIEDQVVAIHQHIVGSHCDEEGKEPAA